MPALRPVLHIIGLLLGIVAAAMTLPALLDWADGSDGWRAFAASAAATLFVGGGLMLACQPERRVDLTVRQTFVLTGASWVLICGFAALPFVFGASRLSYSAAYFEAMSGLTTTGSTVIVGLDRMPRGILLWRALLHMLGGVGIVVMAVAILPFLRIGGMQLFRTESSDRSDKLLPRVSQMASAIVVVYFVLVGVCLALLWAVGMHFFDALCHTLATISTGGFSTYDASVGQFRSPAVEVVITVFMLLGGTTLSLFIRFARGDFRPLRLDTQLHWYFGIFLAFSAAIALWQVVVNGALPLDAIRVSAFTVASILTTTGFATEDYSLWGAFPVACIFFLTFLGGMTGSTSGGIKIFRLQVFYSVAKVQIDRLMQPHRVILPLFNGKAVAEPIVFSVLAFLTLYGMSFGLISLGLGLFGLDLVTALSGAATALGNVGPGLGEVIGPAGNFSTIPDGALWILSFGMLLGRLELLTVFVLFTPAFWRD
ncbi:TrkH family potassium uptake protein [Stella sp.]|uniref:TrkH family potassium uptake protein n=1 Tax=Stella sp. TaxID=2912054 RepID=UPI0035B0F9C7